MTRKTTKRNAPHDLESNKPVKLTITTTTHILTWEGPQLDALWDWMSRMAHIGYINALMEGTHHEWTTPLSTPTRVKNKCQKPGMDDGEGRRILRGMCCCNCLYHYQDHSHPCTDGQPCTNIRGWICGAPDLGYQSGWSEHGLCECWDEVKP